MILRNCGDKRIDVLDVIFVLCYRNVLNRKVAVTQPEKRKVSRSAKNSALGSLFCMVCSYYIALVINNDSRLPIILFVGQHFSGLLFCAITLLLCLRETTQEERVRRSKGAFPSPLRFSPKSVIPLERREEREHCFCNAQSILPLS